MFYFLPKKEFAIQNLATLHLAKLHTLHHGICIRNLAQRRQNDNESVIKNYSSYKIKTNPTAERLHLNVIYRLVVLVVLECWQRILKQLFNRLRWCRWLGRNLTADRFVAYGYSHKAFIQPSAKKTTKTRCL